MLNLARRIKKIESQSKRSIHSYEYGCINLINKSGGILYPGDIVILDNVFSYSVDLTTNSGAQAPLVVLDQGDDQQYVKCTKRGYGIMEVICDGPAIVPGDAIVTSSTARYGQLDNAATGRNLLGFALESKENLEIKAISILI